MSWSLSDQARIGDHIWWVSDVRRFQNHYPDWKYKYYLHATLEDIHEGFRHRDRATA